MAASTPSKWAGSDAYAEDGHKSRFSAIPPHDVFQVLVLEHQDVKTNINLDTWITAVLTQLLSIAIFLGTPCRSEVDGAPDKTQGSPLLATWLRLHGWTARQSDTVDY